MAVQIGDLTMPALARFVVPIILVCGALSGSVAQAQRAEEKKVDWNEKLRCLRDEVLVHAVLTRLGLSKEQMVCMLECAYRSRRAKEAYDARIKVLAPLFEKACQDLHREDEAYRGLSDKVMNRAQRIEHQIKIAFKAMAEEVNTYESKVSACLTPAQQALVRNFNTKGMHNLMRMLHPRKGPEDRKSRSSKVVRALFERIRSWSDIEYDAEASKTAARLVEGFDKYRAPLEDKKAYTTHLLALFRKVRAMDADTFKAGLPGLRLDPPNRIREIHQQLKAISKSKYGAVGPIGKFILMEPTISILEKRLGLARGAGAPAGCGETPGKKKIETDT
jgi:hypothetical protein